MKKNAAFTLIELLVVIAIIAILATLAVPNILGSIETAKSNSDLANLSSLGKGLQRYLIDNEDDMFKRNGSSAIAWPQALYNYLKDWRVFQSPLDKRPPATQAPYPVSYGLNSNCMDTNVGQYTSPSQLLVMANMKLQEKGANQFQGTSSTNPLLNAGQGLGTHKSGKMINCLFCDYHAVALNITDYRDTNSVKGRDRWIPVNNTR